MRKLRLRNPGHTVEVGGRAMSLDPDSLV
jgi:hypothetical protein